MLLLGAVPVGIINLIPASYFFGKAVVEKPKEIVEGKPFKFAIDGIKNNFADTKQKAGVAGLLSRIGEEASSEKSRKEILKKNKFNVLQNIMNIIYPKGVPIKTIGKIIDPALEVAKKVNAKTEE